MLSAPPRYAIRSIVPEEIYTDRQEFLDYFYHYALQARTRRAMSTVLLGQRRMGKTEIFKRVVNRLFFEQDHTDPDAVVPVYYCFQDTTVDRWEFSLGYAENFLRWYVAFRWREPEILDQAGVKLPDLLARVRAITPLPGDLKGILTIIEGLQERSITSPDKTALQFPREISDRHEKTIVLFLDEFQNTRLSNDRFEVVGFMQNAVESPTCPHFVTGSAMSILAKEILGRGALFGRFESDPIEPLTAYWGAELARRVAEYYHAELDDLVAPVLSNRCGGNPFYITAVVKQAAKQRQPLNAEDAVNTILAIDLSSGFIWAELNDQVMRWIQRINEHGITKWVLYLSALEDGERIEPEHIQQRLYEKDGKRVSIDIIRDVLIRLSRGDLLEYMELGGWFHKVSDPILLDFLRAWGKFEVEGQSQTVVITETVKQYDSLQRQIHDQKGYLAEIYLSQILWNAQHRTLPGRYFHSDQAITFPHPFYSITHRQRIDAAANSEVDVYAFASREIWLCESKWWETRKVGVTEVRAFLELAEKMKAAEKQKGYDLFTGDNPYLLKLWLFAHNGVTRQAEALLREHGMYWSDRADLDELIQRVGLRRLPDINNHE